MMLKCYILGQRKIESSYTNLNPCVSIFNFCVCVEMSNISNKIKKERKKEDISKEDICTLICSGERECSVSFGSLVCCGLVELEQEDWPGRAGGYIYHRDAELLDLCLI